MGNTASANRHRNPRRLEPSKPQGPKYPPIPHTLRNPQTACLLLRPRFPLELRLAIYEAVLSDPTRLMHIVPFTDGSNRIGRRKCLVPESEQPTMQHKCFGRWLVNGGAELREIFTFEEWDQQLGLVLSCHQIYVEALDVLYATNRFSVQASEGLRAFHSVTPAPQWAKIRHLEISTLFLTPRTMWSQKGTFPPERMISWTLACEAMKTLRAIRRLCVEMLVWDLYDRVNASAVDDDSLVAILEPLNELEAPHFTVEMNIAIPDGVLARLGKLAFMPVVRQRPYERELDPGL